MGLESMAISTQASYCNDDSPRTKKIAEARGEQAGAALKGLASDFGLGDVAKKVSQSVDAALKPALAPTGTRFCPEYGTKLV